jgi:hypothetical protein
MMICIRLAVAIAVCLGICAVARAQEEEKIKTELDAAANPRLLDTLFSRYGFEPLKTIQRKNQWVQIRLPGEVEGEKPDQTGLYSYFALAGDFTFEVQYFWGQIPVPQGGYGMSCGIALDTNGPAGMLQLARNFSDKKKGSGYVVVQGKPDETGKMDYKAVGVFKTTAKNGKLALKREKGEIVCLASEDKGALKELCRVEFTEGTVRQIRLYADPGGSPTAMNAWIGHVKIHAQEITGGFPKMEKRPWSLLDWLILGGVFLVVVLIVFVFISLTRKKK